MREFWYDVVKEKYYGDQSSFEKLNEALLKVQANIQASNQADMEKLRREVIEAVKPILELQGRAAEQLKYVPVGDLSRQANSAVVGSSNIQVMGMPETLRKAAEQKKSRRAGARVREPAYVAGLPMRQISFAGRTRHGERFAKPSPWR